MIGSGAKVLGPFRVGDNARIAANAVVLSEVPAGCTAVGVPAQIARSRGEIPRFTDEVDQIHVDNPVYQELCALSTRMEELEQTLKSAKERTA